VARAKRTERAEARRRYREATAVETNGDAVEAPEISPAALPREARASKSAAAVPAPEPGGRKGFASALRAAAGPVDIRGDLRALPEIVVRSKAVWLPSLIIVGTAIAMAIPAIASNQFVTLVGNVVLQPPPMIIAFLAGMLAPRGAWLVGGIVSLLSGIAWIIIVAVTTDTLITPLGFPYLVGSDQKMAYAVNVLLTSPIFGIAIGAFAGFYRRFLNMSSPQRQAAQQRQSGRRR
jgi:hypothetical protein